MSIAIEDLPDFVRPDDGYVSRAIFWDQALYQEELERIYTRSWLYLCHESQIREPGDYVTNYMGEDPVIVSRDEAGQVRAFLNSCPHRGMKVCRTDAGNAQFYRCSYHGWTFANDGQLVGVPRFTTAYCGELDRESIGLFAVPRVEIYGGFVFGNWDAKALSLAEYLGDLRWYLDIIAARHLGGIEVYEGVQRYSMEANWKAACSNFSGDTHHVLHTHAASFKIGHYPTSYDAMGSYQVCFEHGHGYADLPEPGAGLKYDLMAAEMFGPDVVEYVHELQRVLDERLDPEQAETFKLGVGNIFPNFSMNDYISLAPIGLYQWHPKGPDKIEIWQGAAMDRGAPQIVRDFARASFTQTQAVAGLFGMDDTENFSQVTQATRGVVSRRHDFNYRMALGHQLERPGQPGQRFSQKFTEENERNFYRVYLKRMLTPMGS